MKFQEYYKIFDKPITWKSIDIWTFETGCWGENGEVWKAGDEFDFLRRKLNLAKAIHTVRVWNITYKFLESTTV